MNSLRAWLVSQQAHRAWRSQGADIARLMARHPDLWIRPGVRQAGD